MHRARMILCGHKEREIVRRIDDAAQNARVTSLSIRVRVIQIVHNASKLHPNYKYVK